MTVLVVMCAANVATPLRNRRYVLRGEFEIAEDPAKACCIFSVGLVGPRCFA